MNTSWTDFNDAQDTAPIEQVKLDPAEIKTAIIGRLHSVVSYLFPNGKEKNNQFFIGDISGESGKSLVIELAGDKAGVWNDFNTGEKGDIFDAWAYHARLDCQTEFPQLLKVIAEWLGTAPTYTQPLKPKNKSIHYDDCGPITAEWNYYDVNENLICVVYRFDPADGKEFKILDVLSGKYRAPDPRPLYNLPGIAKSKKVIFVEGEKCALSLIESGITATTAMCGSTAPIDKTDWSPLKGKDIVIWPDNDETGKKFAKSIAEKLANVGARSVEVLQIPDDKPAKWDCADAIDDEASVDDFINSTERFTQPTVAPLEAFTLGELLDDTSPIPDDLIEPRVLTPGGMIVLGGAAKVGKSDFVLSWLVHMAAGEPFLGMKTPRRLRVFYLQAEVQYHYLRERLQNMKLPEILTWRAGDNLFITPQLKLVLNDQGMEEATNLLRKASEKEPIDIIVIDPLRNLFDGGEDGASENDNQAMMYFLKQRVEKLRDAVNPKAGIIIVHHTKKLQKKQLIEDPFLSFSGASSLRGYYTTGMLLYRPDEDQSGRVVTYELRNGPPLLDKFVDKKRGNWMEIDREIERLTNQEHGAKLDAERRRKQDQILQLIYDEAAQGRTYTMTQFAEAFEGRDGLGAERTIRERLGVLATKGYIKYFKDGTLYGKRKLNGSKFGYMCVEDMKINTGQEIPDKETGELMPLILPVLPTTYRSAETGMAMPVENPEIWVYHDDKSEGSGIATND